MHGRTRPLVAIDGPSGSGKSTVGKSLARTLGFAYVDTGAMYRAVALLVMAEPDPEVGLERVEDLMRSATIATSWDPEGDAFRITLDGRDVSREVRSVEATRWASRVAAVPVVRTRLVAIQRAIGRSGGVVMEGRDIGTEVFPDAEHKFYLDAQLSERGRRRTEETGLRAGDVASAIAERDRVDSSRPVAPLRRASDAISIDTTGLSIEEVTRVILGHIRSGSERSPER